MLVATPHPAFPLERITVVYPDISSPYKDVFETILEGISTDSRTQFQRYPLPKDYQQEDLKRVLDNGKTDGIIALGKRSYLAVKNLKTNVPTVSGGLSIIPNGISGISLSADPESLFSRLKSLVPSSKRVFVVYSEKNTGWLIPLAEQAAAKLDLQLLAYPADNLREAVHHYRNILKQARDKDDAIWLPLDKVTTNDDVVLPMLLQGAWDKDLVIISNKPSHAKRGALLAMYPDNYGLGQELTLLLEKLTTAPATSQVIPLRRLHLAVNLRTAAHLGLNFTPRQEEDFKLTFPSR
jgi:putative ABC transport system substrate-binding protein